MGRTLLILIHNPAVGDVWTLSEICQACAPRIPHIAVLPGAVRPSGGSVTGPAKPASPVPVQAVFSSPQLADADEVSAARRTQRSSRARNGRGSARPR